MSDFITEPARQIPVIAEADLCVVGGSCTGVFAAIRAARLGLRVILIERQNSLGGVAVSGLVNIWHTLNDTDDREQIISGLTEETLDRLKARKAAYLENRKNGSYNFNPSELAILLDELAAENKIRLMLHTYYSAVVSSGSEVQTIIVENSDGRGAIRARFFIDATGDGFIARDLGLPSYANDYLQPPTACFHLQGNMDGVDLRRLVLEHGEEFGLDDDWGWSTNVAGCKGITMRADQHVFGVRCDRADDLTRAELEGRRLMRAFVAMLQKYGRDDTSYALTNICSSIGLRETVHYKTRFCASELPLLTGERYEAPILNGTYPCDIHHSSGGGISFKYLDGRESTIYGKGTRSVGGNWRERMGLTGEPAKYYQVPFDILVGDRMRNFIAVGRVLNADMTAYGALRVMVNLNQIGEAAGTAAALCVDKNADLRELDGRRVTKTLRDGGSAL